MRLNMETYLFGWKKNIFAMKFSLIFLMILNVPVAAIVSYCYHNKHDSVNMMLNQSCATGEDHLTENLVSTDYNSSEKLPVKFDRKGLPKSHIEMCVVFRYIVKQNLSSAVTAQSSSANFSCDFKNWCSGKSTGLYPNVSFEGHTGDMYCCNTNNCNTVSTIPQLPPPQICYKNVHHWGHNVRIGAGTFTLCKDPDSWCIRSRLLNASRPAIVYDCDNQHQCQHFNMTSGSSLVCRNVSQARGKEELCCCSGQSCFSPPSRSTASVFGTPIAEEQRARQKDGLSAVTVGCIVAFTLLALVGGAVMIGLMYQRRSLPDSSNLTLTYSRIEDDDISDSIQML